MAITKSRKLYGTDVPDAKRKQLHAGPITAIFDNGSIRYITYNGVEVLRGISYLVRDKNWGTYNPAITNLKIKQAKTGFTVSYAALCKDDQQSISYTAQLTASSNGVLKFSATGLPQTDFLTNRTGFVVLHPLQGVVGKPVEIVHTDGKKKKGRFPKIISPGQPVFEIRSLRNQVAPGLTSTVLMEGNKFEMEDHRNWMDASYKTYVCSLLDPWPYTLAKGKAFDQSITLTIAGRKKSGASRSKANVITATLGTAKGVVPRVGAGVPMAEAGFALAQSEAIKRLNLSTLVCQIDGRHAGQEDAARAFAELSRKINVSVKLEIILPAKAPAKEEVAVIAKAVRAGGLKPASIVVTQMHDLKSFQPNTPRPWGPTYEEMASAARHEFPGVALGGGMLSYFTELNRKPVPKGLFDFVTHTVCPIVHAPDDISVMETLESLPSIFASARNMIGKTPYHLGPSSIPCRDNPYGAAVAKNPDKNRVCLADTDPRQSGLFAAAWNIGLSSAAARAQLNELTLGAVTGDQGVIEAKSLRPAYHSVAAVAALAGSKYRPVEISAPSKIAALAADTKSQIVLLLANLTADVQTIKIKNLKGKAMLRTLDESSLEAATAQTDFLHRNSKPFKPSSSLKLRAYAMACITVQK